MATRKDIKDSKYLTKEDCEPNLKVTISDCVEEDVSMESQPVKMKYVLYFKEQEKGMVLNLTNFQLIETLTGQLDSDNWGGAQITLYNDPTVMFAGERKGGIRVWVPQTAPPGVGAAPAPTSQHVGDDPPPPTDADVEFDPDKPDGIPY